MVNGRILRNKNASFLLVSPTVNNLFFLLFGIFYGIMEIERAKKVAYYMICIAVVDDEKAVCDELLFFLKEYEVKILKISYD